MIERVSRWPVSALLAAVAVVYAFLTRWVPFGGDDVFFMLNTARWIVEHHQVPWVDSFSYTASGASWIYPVGGGLLFYGLWLIGGYAALSYAGAVGCAATVAMLLRKSSIASVALAVIAVPLIAARCQIRADLFSTILTAGFVKLLWDQQTTGRARLWLLPVLMVAWVNAHLGFVLGIALIGAYVGIEILEMPWAHRRRLATARLRRAWPWLIACLPATLLNPYGPWIYEGVWQQLDARQLQYITEWAPISLNWTAISSAMLSPADPYGASYIVLFLALALAVVAALRKQLAAAALLIGAAMLAVGSFRFSAILGIVFVAVGTSVICGLCAKFDPPSRILAVAAVGAFAIAVSYVRLTAYAEQGWPLFTLGLPPDFPERAAAFVVREHLPGEILIPGTRYGAYVTWETGHRSYYDSRVIPFGWARFYQAVYWGEAPPGPQLEHEAAAYGISTILVSLPQDSVFRLRDFCDSDAWSPVYLDEVSAIFIRRQAETEQLIQRLRINCNDVTLTGQWTNIALVRQKLRQYAEARVAIQRALDLAPRSALAHMVSGQLFESAGTLDEAEREYRTAASILPTFGSEMALAGIYGRKGRIEDEIKHLHFSIDLARGFRPTMQFQMLARAEMRAGRPELALRAIDHAIDLFPGPRPDVFLKDRETALRAIARANPPQLPGGYMTGLRR